MRLYYKKIYHETPVSPNCVSVVKPSGTRPATCIDRVSGAAYTLTVNWTSEQTREAAQRRLRKEGVRRMELEERRAAARRYATELAQQIGAADTTVRRIWGFGSVFDQRLGFRAGSDIDLAVEGGSIVAWKMSRQSEWKVDWVELGEQDESMVQSIMNSGVVLYER